MDRIGDPAKNTRDERCWAKGKPGCVMGVIEKREKELAPAARLETVSRSRQV